MPTAKPSTVTGYIEAAPKKAQEKLREIQTILKGVAPKAKATLKWGCQYLKKAASFSPLAHVNHFSTSWPRTRPWSHSKTS